VSQEYFAQIFDNIVWKSKAKKPPIAIPIVILTLIAPHDIDGYCENVLDEHTFLIVFASLIFFKTGKRKVNVPSQREYNYF